MASVLPAAGVFRLSSPQDRQRLQHSPGVVDHPHGGKPLPLRLRLVGKVRRGEPEQAGLAGRIPAPGGGWEPVEWEGRRYYAQCRELEGADLYGPSSGRTHP